MFIFFPFQNSKLKKKNSKEIEKKAINPWANRVEVKMEKGKTEVKIFP